MLEISLSLKEMIKDNVDTLSVPETKLDNIYQQVSFPFMVIQLLTALTELRLVVDSFCLFENIFPLK